jgi:hypothetical protein
METITIEDFTFFVISDESFAGVALAEDEDNILIADSKNPDKGYLSVSSITLLKLMICARKENNLYSSSNLEKMSGHQKHLEDLIFCHHGDHIELTSYQQKVHGTLEFALKLDFSIQEWDQFIGCLEARIVNLTLNVNDV